MKNTTAKYWRMALQGIFGTAVYCFWAVLYPFALAWQEQFQLFLFSRQYLMERLAVPGGAAAYVAEFLVQFYNNPFLGAGVLALLYLLLQMLVWRLMTRNAGSDSGKSDLLFVLSFLPSLALWFIMGDENVMLAFPVSLILALTAMLLYPSGKKERLFFSLFSIPFVYWITGPMVFVPVLYMLVKELRGSGSWIVGAGVGIGQAVYALFCILLSAQFEPYPLRRLLGGIFYYRIPEILPYSVIGIAALCLLLVFFPVPMKSLIPKKRQRLSAGIGLCLMIAASILFIPKGYDSKKYELMEYDYLVRVQRWNDIIQKAEKRQPDLPMSVCATNLALGMTGQLGERAFEFFQKGPEGLLPKFERAFSTTLLTGEAYYHLGLVNTAQRYAFEAMESIPNYNKSGRVMKRLAETNLINGQYKVAEKYLLMLKKTVFYRKWAQGRLEMVADSGRIERHPVYGRLRKMRLEKDFLFSETELDKTCGQLLAHYKENALAMQYLLIYPLLNRDLDSFVNYFGYVSSVVRYNPTICQEAVVAFAYMKKKEEVPAGMVNDDIVRRFKSFAQTYAFAGKDSPQLEIFRNTLWYYLLKE